MTGSLQIKNGKYYAVINYKTADGKRKQKWLNTQLTEKGNKRKAEQFLQKALLKYADFDEVESDILFCDYLMKWLENTRGKIEQSTWDGYSQLINRHIYPYFKTKGIKLTEISARDISVYYTIKINEGLSPNTVKRHHSNIRKCLQCAYLEDMIPTNPADKAQKPKSEPYNAHFYDSEQIKELLKASEGIDIEPVIVLCVYYGLRRSEVIGLKWEAVNFKDKTIKIYNTITKMYKFCEKERTKNASSNRTLPLIPAVETYLKNLKEKQNENRMLFGNCYTESDYICVKADGTLIQPDEASAKFKSLIKRNKMPNIRLHDLRHSCASMLIAQGVDIKVIQEWLGHSSISTTGNIYGHLQFKQKISTGILLDNLLDG